ncbi:hypothetical protein PGB90_003569 [Kerria lacca]
MKIYVLGFCSKNRRMCFFRFFIAAITTPAAKKVVASHNLPAQPSRPISAATPAPPKSVTTSAPSTLPSSVITNANDGFPVINSTVNSVPQPEKYNQPLPIPQQAPIIPPLSIASACSTHTIPTAVPPKESTVPSNMAPPPISSVFDPVLESPPQIMMPSTNNIQKYDKPSVPVITTSNTIHSIDDKINSSLSPNASINYITNDARGNSSIAQQIKKVRKRMILFCYIRASC